MEQCKRHPEVKAIVGGVCLKCMAEMGEDSLRRGQDKLDGLCSKHPLIQALTANGNCPQCLTDEHFGAGQIDWVTAGVPCKGHSKPLRLSAAELHSTLAFPPIPVHRPNLDNIGWRVNTPVEATRWQPFREFLSKLLRRKENSMQHVFTREVIAKYPELEAAGCVIKEKVEGDQTFKVLNWPNGTGGTTSLSLDVFRVRFLEAGFEPSPLESKLEHLRVGYTVRVYDPSKEVDGPINTAAPGTPITVAEGVGLSPAQLAIRARQASEKQPDPTVTRVLTVALANLEAAGFNSAYTDDGKGIKVWLKDTPFIAVHAEQSVVDQLGCHLTFTFTGLRPAPFELELSKYRVSHTVVRDVDYPKPEPVASVKLPRRTITAQLPPLKTIEGIRFCGNMDQPGWRVTIPAPSTETPTHHTFTSQASDELTCVALGIKDLSLLEELLHFHRVPYEVDYPLTQISNCIRKAQVASIQVAATRQSDNGFEVVGENDVGRTHWSVYLRDEEGLVTHVEDYKISGLGGPARADAMQHAAGLSIQHQVPIEPIP